MDAAASSYEPGFLGPGSAGRWETKLHDGEELGCDGKFKIQTASARERKFPSECLVKPPMLYVPWYVLFWEGLEKVTIDHCFADMLDGVVSSGDERKSTEGDLRKVPVFDTKNNGPRLQQPGTPMAVVTGSAASQPWRSYLDQILGLCRNAAGTPEPKVFQPPPELLATTRPLLPAEPGPTISDEEAGSIGGECVGRDTGNPDENEGGVLRVPAHPSDAHPLVLVLLDMNGTLLYRAKKPLPIIVPEDDGRDTAPAFIHGDPLPLHYYMRPGAKEFVAAMVRHPRVCLAFYTSMRGVNAIPAARFLMPDDVNGSPSSSDEGQAGPEVYDRPFNAHDPEGANPWDTTRNLPLVWSTPGRTGEGFGPANTVMVDDTPRKMRFMNAGLVVVPEYTEASVVEVVRGGGGTGTLGSGACEEGELRRGHQKRAHRQVEVMPRLTEYMIRLLERSGEDVRPFIADNPFLPHAPSMEDDPTSGNLATVNLRSLPPAPPSPARKMFGSGDQGAFCFVDAVGILLTSGPLVRLPRKAADAQGAESPEGEVGHGRFVFDGFPRGLEASVVDAVTDVLRAACDAARRWELPLSERERLAVWSGVAANGNFSS